MLSECPLPCRCWDDSYGDGGGDNGEDGKSDDKGYIYSTTPALLPAGGWTTVSHFTAEGSGSQKERICWGTWGVGTLHGQGRSDVTLICNFFRDLRSLVTMLSLTPLLSPPEAEDSLASVLSSSRQSNPFKALLSPHLGCTQHLAGHWECQDVGYMRVEAVSLCAPQMSKLQKARL